MLYKGSEQGKFRKPCIHGTLPTIQGRHVAEMRDVNGAQEIEVGPGLNSCDRVLQMGSRIYSVLIEVEKA